MRGLLLFLFLIPTLLFGQGFGGGLYGGISTSQVTGDAIVGFHKVGAWGGAYTDYRFTPRSTLQFELSFIQKGSRQAPNVKNNGVLYVNNQNFLELPILYRWYGIKNMSIEMGTQFGYLINAIERDNAGEIRGGLPFRKVEWSVAAGLSYYVWKNKIEINARYANSILSLKKQDWWMNHVIGFSVRYWFKTTLDKDKLEATKKKNQVEIKLE